jgi:hypothetical protein
MNLFDKKIFIILFILKKLHFRFIHMTMHANKQINEMKIEMFDKRLYVFEILSISIF